MLEVIYCQTEGSCRIVMFLHSTLELCFHWRCEGVSLCKSGWPEATPRYHVAAISSKLQRIGTYNFQIQLIYLLSFSVFIEY